MKSAPVKETPLPSPRLTAAERRQAYKRLVDFVNKKKDRRAIIMGAMGCFSASYIASKCNLSEGQVTYRFKKGNVSMRETRGGSSPFVPLLMDSAYDTIDAHIERHLLGHVPNLYEIAEMAPNGHNGHNGHNGNGHRRNGRHR